MTRYKVGDRVEIICENEKMKPVKKTVSAFIIWVHPKKRFALAQYGEGRNTLKTTVY